MLRNEKYIGDWTWNKTKWFKKNVTGKRLKIDNPPEKWIVHKDEALRIVPQQLWEVVHSASTLKSAGKPSRSRPANGKYPLSGLLVCAECGSSYIVATSGSYSAYICNGYWARGTTVCGCNHRINRKSVEDAVLGKLSEVLLSDKTCQRIADDVNSKLKTTWQSPEERRATLLSQKSSLSKAVENLLDVAEKGGLTESLKKRLLSKESQLSNIERELASLAGERPAPKSVDSAWVKDKLSGLSNLLQRHTDSMSAFRATLRNLFPDKLTVRAIEESGRTLFKISGNAMPLNALGESGLPKAQYSGAGTCNTIGTTVPVEVTVTMRRKAA